MRRSDILMSYIYVLPAWVCWIGTIAQNVTIPAETSTECMSSLLGTGVFYRRDIRMMQPHPVTQKLHIATIELIDLLAVFVKRVVGAELNVLRNRHSLQ